MCKKPVLALALAGAMAAACGDDGGGMADADAGPVADAGDTEPDADETEPDAMTEEATELERLCAPDGALVGLLARGMECQPLEVAFRELIEMGSTSPERLSTFCTLMLGDYVADGTIALDEEAVDGCLEWLETAPCEVIETEDGPPSTHGTPCDGLIVGSVEVGSSCEMTEQCAGDAYCNDDIPVPAGTDETCGQCTARLADGEECTSDQQCSSGHCDDEDTCATPGDVGDECTTDDDCAGGLVCDAEAETCALSVPREGTTCTTQSDCETPILGLYCDVEAGMCKRLPQPGEPCLQLPDQEPLCDPLHYVWCSPVDDTCKAPEITEEGQPCSPLPSIGSGALRCGEGLACTSPGTNEDGTPGGVCYSPGTDGDPCGVAEDGTDQCQFPYLCVENVCVIDNGYTGMCPAPEMP